VDRHRVAGIWFGATLAVGAFALIAQLVLVLTGASVLIEDDPPTRAESLWRFASYFTVQANVAVFLSVLPLVRNPQHDGGGWRVLRLSALVGIVITGIVHWFLLRPLLSLIGWSYATDKLLHVVVPLMAVVGWLAFGPRPRITGRVLGLALIWPVAWLLSILVVGAVTDWYPYPFLDVGTLGAGPVAASAAAIAVGFFAVSGLAWLADRRLSAGQEQGPA